MKKATLLVISSVAALYATSIQVPAGWSLLGAINSITPSQITCANTVWTYDNSAGNWNLYVKNPGTVTNNYGFNQISGISSGQGFWVNNTSGSPCSLDFNATTPTTPIYYNAFGYTFMDRKSDATYTVSNSLGTNTVVFSNTTAPLFTLNAYRNNDADSKAGLLFAGLSDTNQLSAVDARLKLVTGTTGYNKAQLNVGRFAITGDTVNVGHTGIGLNKNGIFVWFEKRNGTTLDLVETTLASTNINTTNMVGKTVDARISINGSTINYQVTGDVNASYSYTTPSTLTLESGIRFAEVRARNDDTTTTDGTLHSGDVTTVEFSAMGVLPYLADINATPVATLNFADLPSFMMMDGDGDSYTKVTKTASTFGGADYEFDGTTWVEESSFNGTVSGNRVTLLNGGVYEFAIQGTQKINNVGTMSFSDLYMSQATTTVITAPTEYEYEVWDWENPSYYNGTSQVLITNLSTFIAAFTDPNSGNSFGGGEDDKTFLNSDGKVVKGTWDGTSYYTGDCTGDCRIFTRTSEEIGSWTSDSTRVYVEIPKESLTFEVVSNGSGGYAIQEGWRDKVGAVWNEVILSGTQATDEVVRAYISSHQP